MTKLHKDMRDAVLNGVSDNGIIEEVVRIAERYAQEQLDENLKTSAEWNAQREFKDVHVWDPDGWDRGNFEFSWHRERITLEEFKRRLSRSTVMCYTPTGEPRWSPQRNG